MILLGRWEPVPFMNAPSLAACCYDTYFKGEAQKFSFLAFLIFLAFSSKNGNNTPSDLMSEKFEMDGKRDH